MRRFFVAMLGAAIAAAACAGQADAATMYQLIGGGLTIDGQPAILFQWTTGTEIVYSHPQFERAQIWYDIHGGSIEGTQHDPTIDGHFEFYGNTLRIESKVWATLEGFTDTFPTAPGKYSVDKGLAQYWTFTTFATAVRILGGAPYDAWVVITDVPDDPVDVPEPATAILFAVGLAGLAGVRAGRGRHLKTASS